MWKKIVLLALLAGFHAWIAHHLTPSVPLTHSHPQTNSKGYDMSGTGVIDPDRHSYDPFKRAPNAGE